MQKGTPFLFLRIPGPGNRSKAIRRGWCLGDETFRKELLENVHTRATESHHAETRRETTEEKARRILNEELDKLGWTGAELARRAKGDARKICIAQRLRAETAVTLKCIAAELNGVEHGNVDTL